MKVNAKMTEKRKQEYCARQEQTKEQYAFTVFLTCPQQTDQMIWWSRAIDRREMINNGT